ncbi:MAG: hypothetical protein V4662_22975 [Verrucomicrobiota bacterium]
MTASLQSSLLQRLIALLLLAAYTVSGTSALPAVLVLVASLEGSHEVLIGQVDGSVSLTLHHRPDEYTPCVEDHQSASARVLVSLCRSSGQGDHQITSTRFDTNAEREKETLASLSKQPLSVNQSATFQLEQLLTDRARATSRQGKTTPVPVTAHEPALRPALSTVQMLV